MSTIRMWQIICDGCAVAASGLWATPAQARRVADLRGWKSIPGNGAARGPHRTERTDWCPSCEPPK